VTALEHLAAAARARVVAAGPGGARLVGLIGLERGPFALDHGVAQRRRRRRAQAALLRARRTRRARSTAAASGGCSRNRGRSAEPAVQRSGMIRRAWTSA
jgi:hypothetical protein